MFLISASELLMLFAVLKCSSGSKYRFHSCRTMVQFETPIQMVTARISKLFLMCELLYEIPYIVTHKVNILDCGALFGVLCIF